MHATLEISDLRIRNRQRSSEIIQIVFYFGFRLKSLRQSATRTSEPSRLPGGNSEREPPDPIPNSEVNTLSADGSVGSPHVRVGHRQALNAKPHPTGCGFFWGAPTLGLCGALRFAQGPATRRQARGVRRGEAVLRPYPAHPHVRVGHRQALNAKAAPNRVRFFLGGAPTRLFARQGDG